jgi:hypothetical protein
MPLSDEIQKQGDVTLEVLCYFLDQRRRYNSSRDFLTDLLKSHANDTDCHNQEISLYEVERHSAKRFMTVSHWQAWSRLSSACWAVQCKG